MEMNATLFGQMIFVLMIIIGIGSYFIARRKSDRPVLLGVLGALLSIVPLFGVIYLIVLALKKDR